MMTTLNSRPRGSVSVTLEPYSTVVSVAFSHDFVQRLEDREYNALLSDALTQAREFASGYYSSAKVAPGAGVFSIKTSKHLSYGDLCK